MDSTELMVSARNRMPKTSKKIFTANNRSIQGTFRKQRNKITVKLQNPRLKQIHFHTLRHWKATIEYHRTRNLPYVKQLLGHKSLNSTDIYTHPVDFGSKEYHVAHAKTLEEEGELLKTGFEFVRYSQVDKIAIYRKRK